ncbi:hypothetical protein HMPREF0539_2988 [Lacticaseibacillus rhamnosus LMS2-1]|uniref:Uncharacterized protein n=1 Tax=Lacticaseibacillus rhamnosus (strain LMS2-1) TaxID=525361 RepID=C2K1F3_LACRM|nr:hypothetical protein HMPREF0539_2988 [Lacticaseibacillus rhamnosus LMS2-1]
MRLVSIKITATPLKELRPLPAKQGMSDIPLDILFLIFFAIK